MRLPKKRFSNNPSRNTSFNRIYNYFVNPNSFGTTIAAYTCVMIIAIPTWMNRVSPLFDTAERIVIVDVTNGQITQMSEERIPNSSFNSLINRANYLGDQKVDVLICGGISRTMVSLLLRWEINVISGTMGDVNSVLDAYLNNSLENRDFRMPGCRRRGRNQRGGGKGRGRGGNRNR